jgi:hypothetical protein
VIIRLEVDSSVQRSCTRLLCGRVGIEIVSELQSGIAVGMVENMERLQSRELDGVFGQYLRIIDASSEHRFLRLNTGGNGVVPRIYISCLSWLLSFREPKFGISSAPPRPALDPTWSRFPGPSTVRVPFSSFTTILSPLQAIPSNLCPKLSPCISLCFSVSS